jgi:hypothetical protein
LNIFIFRIECDVKIFKELNIDCRALLIYYYINIINIEIVYRNESAEAIACRWREAFLPAYMVAGSCICYGVKGKGISLPVARVDAGRDAQISLKGCSADQYLAILDMVV